MGNWRRWECTLSKSFAHASPGLPYNLALTGVTSFACMFGHQAQTFENGNCKIVMGMLRAVRLTKKVMKG